MPMRVQSLDRENGLATCDGATVDVTLVWPVDTGDLVLVHAGAAIARLAPERK